MKLIVFIIALNEEEMIGKVLEQIPSKIDGIDQIEKMVISDGSTDDTVKISKQHGAIVHAGKSQRRLAYRFAEAIELCLKYGADIAVNIDGDLQFNPADIPMMVKPIIEEDFDFVAADRFTDPETNQKRRPKDMPIGKYLSNRLGAWIVGKLSGYRFNDVTCGFRAYNRDALYAININNKYTYTQESFQVLALKKFNMTSIPVPVKYYPGRRSRVVTSFLNFLVSSGVNILRAFRDHAPLVFFGWLGFGFFVLASITAGFIGIHYIRTGAISPYKSIGFISIYFASMAFFIWGLGIVADMFDRNNNNQEKILERIKRIQYK